jgi:chemotaxis protein MotB
MVPEARKLIDTIAQSVAASDNPIMIRGHTDSRPFDDPNNMNNWMLSSGRAEETRRVLAGGGVKETRFERIEGVADRDPLIVKDRTDPRNRRVSITLLYRRIQPMLGSGDGPLGAGGPLGGGPLGAGR